MGINPSPQIYNIFLIFVCLISLTISTKEEIITKSKSDKVIAQNPCAGQFPVLVSSSESNYAKDYIHTG